ncbi:MAG: hypothetical protein PHQ04_04795 [Opitutaceae bacterium]|nr:hypothetical protein [Opitutaceae bacterium]
MQAKRIFLLRTAGLMAGATLALSALRLLGAGTDADALPVFESHIKVSGRPASVTGDKAAYQSGTQQPKAGAYGIEEFRFTRELSKDVSLQVDGRALSGAEDYLAQFRLTKNEVGTSEVGYKRFRTFYGGFGGFFPTNRFWAPLTNPKLSTDRATLWAKGTVALPDRPVFHFGYTNELRNGRKDSTIWGDTDFTGIPIWSSNSLNPISANRKIIPSYVELGERHETLEAAMSHTIGGTTFDLRLANDRVNNLDTRFFNRYPGELQPYPNIPSTPATLKSPSVANNAISGFDQQGISSNALSFTGKVSTALSDQMTVYAGVGYQNMDGDISGARINTLSIMTATGVKYLVGGFVDRGRPPYSYQSAGGTMTAKVFTGNVGVDYKPSKDLSLGAAVKGEDLTTNASNPVNYLNTHVNLATGVVTVLSPVYSPNYGKIHEKSWTPEVSARYTGFKGITFYGTASYRTAPADETSTYSSVGPGAVAGPIVSSSSASYANRVKERHDNYKMGANWRVSSYVMLRGEVFRKDHMNSFYDAAIGATGRYLLDTQTEGFQLTATVRPLLTLAFTTRYVGLNAEMHTTVDAAAEYQSADSKIHQFGETIDWTPNSQVYVQGNLNVVFDTTSTSYPRAGGNANIVLHNADNNYWNASVVAGFVVNKATDAQVQFTCYRADNYDASLIATTPSGAGIKDYTATIGLKHKFSDSMAGAVKVGYFDSRCDTTGGFTNYKGPLFYASVDYAF